MLFIKSDSAGGAITFFVFICTVIAKLMFMTIKLENSQSIIISTISKRMLGDTHTPVSLFLKLRDEYNQVALLESNDFTSKEDSRSFIAVDITDEIFVKKEHVFVKKFNGSIQSKKLDNKDQLSDEIDDFIRNIQTDKEELFNGLFGHTDFDAIQYFESIKFNPDKPHNDKPSLRYALYRFVIAFDHFKDELCIIENIPRGESSELAKLESIIARQVYNSFEFECKGERSSNMCDKAFKELVVKGKQHCKVGDVFQVVFSRRFSQEFSGDDFNVYRALRSLNPSPYLFYFDYGTYKLFGSSPETQLSVSDGIASVNPIAGTFKRQGDKKEDIKKAKSLASDPKENAEHIMLVDLARNDLSIHCKNVKVESLKEVQFFSHVIHLVSKVIGKVNPHVSTARIFGDTFPAGKLSGAPKYRALQLIDKYEPTKRGFYGGAIGIMDLKGNMNQAILIRSFLSMNNKLFYQAGAGIVIHSDEEKELQEINNKLAALNQAILKAEKI